jgi:DNA-binding IclR family transcriptional regulator
MRVLRLLARSAEPVRAAAVARRLGLPRSTTYHLLSAMSDEGFVTHLPDGAGYVLGLGAFELGTAYTRQAPLARLARPLVVRLVELTSHNAHLAVLHGRDVLYVVEERAPRRPVLVSDVDVRLPAAATASGLAILAGMPAAQVRALFPGLDAFVRRHGAGPSTPGELRSVLSATRRSGYSVEDGWVTPGIASVAVAVVEAGGHPVAGLAVTYPSEVVGAVERDGLVGHLRTVAADLSRRLSGTRHPL